MTRAIGPAVGLPPEVAMPFTILGLCWVPVSGAGAVWAGGRAASSLSGHGWSGPPFGIDFARRLIRPRGVEAMWPSTPSWLVWTASGAIAVLTLLVAGLIWWRLWGRGGVPGDPLGSLATLEDVALLAPRQAARRARQLRPSLAARKRVPPADLGVALGRLRTRRGSGPALRASWEDVLLAVMAPRAGKTTALAVPAILAAPGAVIATSNKADLWAATADLRAQRTGERVWVFDPQRITYTDRTWWWNPLRGVVDVEEAHRLAGHFIQEVRSTRGDRDFWSSAAHDLLTGLLLAAALSGRDLTEVYEWVNDPVLVTPVELLRQHGQPAAAASILGRMHGAPETRDGVYETTRTAAQCLRDPQIMAWVTPPRGAHLDEFDAAGFARSRQSLYLLSKDGAGAAAPLVAALTDRVMRDATRAAERRGGRLDPPLVVVLDEATAAASPTCPTCTA